MTESVLLALVSSGSAIAGSLVTGWFTYRAAVRQRETARYKRRLVQAYKDIASFHRLEERYLQALQSDVKSAAAWKLEVRKTQRDAGFDSPSEDATAQTCEQRMSDLS